MSSRMSNSREIFLALLEVSRSLDEKRMEGFVAERDYEELERYVVNALMGRKG